MSPGPLFALSLAVVVSGLSQIASVAPAQTKDPKALLTAAAHYYDFDDPTMKPWHLKATYEFSDGENHSTLSGSFEYWWSSPGVDRMIWNRAGTSYSEWRSADGKFAHEAKGGPISFFERSLPLFLFLKLPDTADPRKVGIDLDSIKAVGKYLDVNTIKTANAPLPCVVLTPIRNSYPGKSYYCFDSRIPAVTAALNTWAVNAEFVHIVKMQGRFLPRETTLLYDGVPVLTATVESAESFSPSEGAVKPSIGATVEKFNRVQVSPAVAWDHIIGNLMPTIPPALSRLPQNHGLVLLDLIVGTEGTVRDVQIVSTPNNYLGNVSVDAASAWKFKPYLDNGIPCEMETPIVLAF